MKNILEQRTFFLLNQSENTMEGSKKYNCFFEQGILIIYKDTGAKKQTKYKETVKFTFLKIKIKWTKITERGGGWRKFQLSRPPPPTMTLRVLYTSPPLWQHPVTASEANLKHLETFFHLSWTSIKFWILWKTWSKLSSASSLPVSKSYWYFLAFQQHFSNVTSKMSEGGGGVPFSAIFSSNVRADNLARCRRRLTGGLRRIWRSGRTSWRGGGVGGGTHDIWRQIREKLLSLAGWAYQRTALHINMREFGRYCGLGWKK